MTRTHPNKLNVLSIQADLHWNAPQNNREHLYSLLTTDAERADLIVLPETFTTGFLGDQGSDAETMSGPTVTWMQDIAAKYACAVTGSVAIDDQGRRNRLLWVLPGGEISYYDKKHLFSFGGEDQRYVAGNRQVTFELGAWRIRPLICYDIRFPVWCRNRGDYDMLLVVANWPMPRISAWSALLRARAIENQCYVVAVNRVGKDGQGIVYNGQSGVFDPMGEAVSEMGDRQHASLATADLQKVNTVREKLPFLADSDEFSLIG